MLFDLCLSFASVLSLTTACSTAPSDDYMVDPANDPRNLERPCPDFNVHCIRDFFWRNSECSTVQGKVPDPLFVDYYVIDVPNANITVDVKDVFFEGLSDAKIVEFYINHVTKKLVLAVEIPCLRSHSKKVTVNYNRKAKESISRTDKVAFDNGAVTMTAQFPSIKYLDLNDARVFTYVDNPSPKYDIGARLTATTDLTAQKEFEKFFASLPEDLQEIFLTQGHLLMVNYIQSNICDFGV